MACKVANKVALLLPNSLKQKTVGKFRVELWVCRKYTTISVCICCSSNNNSQNLTIFGELRDSPNIYFILVPLISLFIPHSGYFLFLGRTFSNDHVQPYALFFLRSITTKKPCNSSVASSFQNRKTEKNKLVEHQSSLTAHKTKNIVTGHRKPSLLVFQPISLER